MGSRIPAARGEENLVPDRVQMPSVLHPTAPHDNVC